MSSVLEHRDGFGLNDDLLISTDKRSIGNASHKYVVTLYGKVVAEIQYQKGGRAEPDAIPGCTDAVLLAIVLDRYLGFQSGPFKCSENSLVIDKVRDALRIMKDRAFARHQRGVLGKNVK